MGYDHLPEHRRKIYARDADHSFDYLIEQALATGKGIVCSRWPDGTPIAGEANAWKLLGKIANCQLGRQHTIRRGTDAGLGPRQAEDGTWQARFRVLPKDQGREHIAALIENGGLPTINPAQRKPRGKYICRTYLGGCGHRRAAAPETLCLGCQAKQEGRDREAEQRARADAERRSWGHGWDDRANWEADHGLIPPRTARERAGRPRADQARQHIDLEQRLRERAEALLDWEEKRPTRPSQGIIRGPRTVIRGAKRAAADRIEASQITDPVIREMLGRLRGE